jgi:hypothetical protein
MNTINMPQEEFDEFVNEFLEQHGGVENAIKIAVQNIEKTSSGIQFKNGNTMEGYLAQPQFWVEVLDELYYRISMN